MIVFWGGIFSEEEAPCKEKAFLNNSPFPLPYGLSYSGH